MKWNHCLLYTSTVKAVWNIADIFNALMAFPNLIALLALNGVIVKETRDLDVYKRQLLYGMYFVLTAAEVVFLLFGGMNLYDALLHAFSTAGTGGFSNR